MLEGVGLARFVAVFFRDDENVEEAIIPGVEEGGENWRLPVAKWKIGYIRQNHELSMFADVDWVAFLVAQEDDLLVDAMIRQTLNG
jgi:hypothetical protein